MDAAGNLCMPAGIHPFQNLMQMPDIVDFGKLDLGKQRAQGGRCGHNAIVSAAVDPIVRSRKRPRPWQQDDDKHGPGSSLKQRRVGKVVIRPCMRRGKVDSLKTRRRPDKFCEGLRRILASQLQATQQGDEGS